MASGSGFADEITVQDLGSTAKETGRESCLSCQKQVREVSRIQIGFELSQRVLSTNMGYTYPSNKANHYYRNHTLHHIGALDPLGVRRNTQAVQSSDEFACRITVRHMDWCLACSAQDLESRCW